MFVVPLVGSTRYRIQSRHPGISVHSPSLGWYNDAANTYKLYEWDSNFAVGKPEYTDLYQLGLSKVAATMVVADGPGALGTAHAEYSSFIRAFEGDYDPAQLGKVTGEALSEWNQLTASADVIGRYFQDWAPDFYVGQFPWVAPPFDIIAQYVGYLSYASMTVLFGYQCMGSVLCSFCSDSSLSSISL